MDFLPPIPAVSVIAQMPMVHSIRAGVSPGPFCWFQHFSPVIANGDAIRSPKKMNFPIILNTGPRVCSNAQMCLVWLPSRLQQARKPLLLSHPCWNKYNNFVDVDNPPLDRENSLLLLFENNSVRAEIYEFKHWKKFSSFDLGCYTWSGLMHI